MKNCNSPEIGIVVRHRINNIRNLFYSQKINKVCVIFANSVMFTALVNFLLNVKNPKKYNSSGKNSPGSCTVYLFWLHIGLFRTV